jgi:hypothetical protein
MREGEETSGLRNEIHLPPNFVALRVCCEERLRRRDGLKREGDGT